MEREWQPQTKRVYDQLRNQLRRTVGVTPVSKPAESGLAATAGGPTKSGPTQDDAVLQSVLAAFPDRVARHRRDGELLLSGGGSAQVDPAGGNAIMPPGKGATHWQDEIWFPTSPLKNIRAKAPSAKVQYDSGADPAAAAAGTYQHIMGSPDRR